MISDMELRVEIAADHIFKNRYRKLKMLKADPHTGRYLISGRNGEDVVIKLFVPNWITMSDSSMRKHSQMFIQEKKASSQISDMSSLIPNTPRFIESGRVNVKDGGYVNSVLGYNPVDIDFITFSKIAGESLSNLPLEFMPFERKIKIIYDTLRCSAAMGCDFNFVHQDINENNIMIDNKNTYLLDFSASGTDKCSGFFGCTPDYAAPEQARALLSKIHIIRHDKRTDVYLIGELAYRMITGENPFEMTSLGQNDINAKKDSMLVTLAKRAEGKTVLNSTGDLNLDSVIRKATQPDMAKRYQTTAEMLAEFRPIALKYGA
jgi:serine/threonine protein kinase